MCKGSWAMGRDFSAEQGWPPGLVPAADTREGAGHKDARVQFLGMAVLAEIRWRLGAHLWRWGTWVNSQDKES